MQNKLHTIQIFSPPVNQFANPQAETAEPRNPEKLQTPRQEGIRTHGNEKHREPPAPQPTPIPKLSMMPRVWNISVGQRGLAAWLRSLPAPAHLPIS